MNDEEIEFGNYGRIARRSWWVLAIGVVVGILLALFFLPTPSQFFESRVSVLLSPGDADISQGADLINEDTEIRIAASQVIGEVVSETNDITLDEWQENITISACLGNSDAIIVLVDDCSTRILEFSYQGNTADEASNIVQSTAETYLAFRSDREQALRADTIENLEAEFADLEVRGDTERAAFLAADEDSLEASLIERRLREIEDTSFVVVSQLTELRSRSSEVGDLLGDPSVPEAGTSGVPRLFAIIAGALIGLMLGAVVAIGLDRLDRRVGDSDELEQDLGVPVVGDIPRITQDSPALVTAVSAHTPGAEAFRRVAAAALASRNGVAVSSIAIAGANENEGRTTTTINLALAMAQTGRDVLVVNTDRRNIVIDRIFGLVGEPGLNDFLRSTADVQAGHQAIEYASQRLGIRLLSTGTGSEASLSSSALQSLIAAAKERNMVVLFDTPPALTHAGGLQIAAIVDAVYVVAASGRTRRSELSELRTQLDNVQAQLSGAIFNRTSRLSLLPAGHGDIATVSVPTGIPGNAKNGAQSPFDPHSPTTAGAQARGFTTPAVNGNGFAQPPTPTPAPTSGAQVHTPIPVQNSVPQAQAPATMQNGAAPTGVNAPPPQVIATSAPAPAAPAPAPAPAPAAPAPAPAAPAPSGIQPQTPTVSTAQANFVTQPAPTESELSDAAEFSNMRGLFGSDADGDHR